jgi:glycosyltransferase involved in cell wall biosynthesis
VTQAERPAALDLLYFAAVDWGYTWQRPQQLASRLARGGRLVYVEPAGLRSARLVDVPRILRRLRPAASTPALEGIRLCRPLAIPFRGSAFVTRSNGRLMRRAVEQVMARARLKEPGLWVGVPSPEVVEAIRGLRGRPLIYDCLDRFALFHADGRAIEQAEVEIATRADLVLATSRELFERMRALNPHTLLVPNGADVDHFATAQPPAPEPADLAGLPHPILGYVGEIADWFDVELAEALAQNPRWSLVLIGPLRSGRARRLLARSNVRHLGPRPYAELPRYLSRFDVCLLPFELNALTAAVNPVKLYEYLASGQPVVSTPLPEVLPFRHVVSVAEATDFPAAVEAALQTAADADARERRLRVARKNTWDQRVETILGALA